MATLIRRGKIKEVKYPYNIGIYKNIKSVLGPNPFLWLWPQKMQGDGLSFPVNPSAGGESATVEWAGIVAPREGSSAPGEYGAADQCESAGSGSGTNGRPGMGHGEERVRHGRARVEHSMV